MFGFRAHNFQHSSLASGRVLLFSHCGADPSRAKNGLDAAYWYRQHFMENESLGERLTAPQHTVVKT
jgi:hypothetical protein